MIEMKCPQFPCESIPENLAEKRLLGIYEQRQKGLLMQRVRINGGRMSLEQWSDLAEIAERFTPDYPIHITTRQDVQLYGLTPETLPALQEALDKAGFSSLRAAGHSLRNITMCTGCGLCVDTHDLTPLADEIRRLIAERPWTLDLPHKFKTALSGCENSCNRSWINDLGLIANADGSFRAILAGSLLESSKRGLLCYENLPREDVPTLAMAALRFFNTEGKRDKKTRMRFRHLRERLGDEVFRQKVDQYFQEEKAAFQGSAPQPMESEDTCAGPGYVVTRLYPAQGNLTPQELFAIVGAFHSKDGIMRIGFEHELVLYGLDPSALPSEIQRLVGAPYILNCPGTDLCVRALAETWPVADALREALSAPCPLMIAISGCPNSCSHATVADIGLLGRVKTLNGEKRAHYRLLAGGGHGSTPALGQELHKALPRERVAEVVAWLVAQWNEAEKNQGPIDFAKFIDEEKERLAESIELQCTGMKIE